MDYTTTEHVWLHMPDSTRLSMRLWLPTQTPCPVVLELIPYRKRDMYRALDDYHGHLLASAGIAFARVDVRGSGDSEGSLVDEYADAEINDAKEIITQLARKEWCNGQVGMRGLSWGAINTLMVASDAPAALRAVLVLAGTDNRFTDDAHFIGHTRSRNGFQWGTQFKLVRAAPPDPDSFGTHWLAEWQQRLEATPNILGQWGKLRDTPEAWPATKLDRIRIPVFLAAGWQDPYANPIWRVANKLPHAKLVIGPWGHTYPHIYHFEHPNLAPPAGDFATQELEWWQHQLGLPDRDQKHVSALATDAQLFMPYTCAGQPGPIRGRWLMKKGKTHETYWYLHSQLGAHGNPGKLLATRPTDRENAHLEPNHIVGQTKPEWLDRPPIEQGYDDELSLIFDSPVLSTPLEILGQIQVRLAIKNPAEPAHVALRVCDIDPQGKSWLVTSMVIDIERYRQHADSASKNQPANTRSTAPNTQLTQTVDICDITLPAIAHRFASGHKLRLALSESLWPLV